jgi:hypothetical protein
MRATGEGFFAAARTLPYRAKGVLLGQDTPDSCVPACTRMLIHDLLPGAGQRVIFSESYLRAAFETDATGSLVSRVPEILKEAGIEGYVYRTDLSFADLRRALKRSAAIGRVIGRQPDVAPVLIVEEAGSSWPSVTRSRWPPGLLTESRSGTSSPRGSAVKPVWGAPW